MSPVPTMCINEPCAAAAEPFEFDFEEEELDEGAVREKVWQEMLCYHPN